MATTLSEAHLQLSREQILSFRRRASHLENRLDLSDESLRQAAWAGLADSMPRAAVLSLHARVESVAPNTWEDASLVQVWGPRFNAYVVAASDIAAFTLGRMPPAGNRRRTAETTAAKLADFLGDRQMTYSDVGRALGVPPNSLRYATLTGRVILRWEGSGKPKIRMVKPPNVSEQEARRDLARHYLRVFGPSPAGAFAEWAGVAPEQAQAVLEELSTEVISVRTPLGEGLILASDEPALLARKEPAATVRLLPSGDNYCLLHGIDRELLVTDEKRRTELWTSRVWPGAVLLDGEIVGTWRRNTARVSVSPWRKLSAQQKEHIEAEAGLFPLTEQPISVIWD